MSLIDMSELIDTEIGMRNEGINKMLSTEVEKISSNSSDIISMMLLGNEVDIELLMKCCAEINSAVTAIQILYDAEPFGRMTAQLGRPAST